MAAQAGFIGGQVHRPSQIDHVGTCRHLAVIWFCYIISLTIDLAEDISLGFPLHIGHSLGIRWVGDEFSLVGVAMTHHAIYILGLCRMGRIAV